MIATSNTMIAKIFAALAVAGLVASSVIAFAPVAGAQTTTTTTTSASVSFSRDLTIGSTGADVTALQNWLISKSFAIAAGATGYFGAQTQAALAKYQAANGISPAAGYFGPITRAKVNAGGSTSGGGTGTGTGTGSSNGGLSGGEANLTDFDLRAEDSEGNEGEEGVELVSAEFDVEDGDVRVERVEFTASSTKAGIENKPWQFFDTLYIMADGKEIGEVDASDRDEWDETTDNVYEIVFTGLDYVVDEGDMASLTLVADVAGNIDAADLSQKFNLKVLKEGIRAVDSEGIQQYTGSNTDGVDVGFGAEENGKLSIRESSEDPEAATLKVEASESSDEYTVFAFDIRNTEDVDTLITKLTIDTTITGSTSTDKVIRTATLVVDGDEHDGDIEAANDGNIVFKDIDVVIGSDETLEFELMVKFTAQSGNYLAGDTIAFDVDPATDIVAEGEASGNSVKSADITGGADSETHTLALTGFMVEAVSASTDNGAGNNATTPANSTGTFTIKFDVTADQDAPTFIDNIAANASTTASTTAGASYNIFRNGAAATAGFTSENSVLTSTADMSGGAFRVNAGATETFTLTVTIDPTQSGLYAIELDAVNYATTAARAISGDAAQNDTFNVDANNAKFETAPLNIAN